MSIDECFFAEFQENLEAFLQVGTPPNTWLQGGDEISVYVRKGRHRINGKLVDTFDIANINVYPPGQGIGSRVIDIIHQRHPFSVTFIESILNSRFYDNLIRNGWLDVEGSKPPSVYKTTD